METKINVEISERIDKQMSIFSKDYGISKKDIVEKSVLCFINAFNN